MPDRPLGLSPRQIECLKLAAAHRTSKEIAAELGLSPHTVDGHIQAAVSALGLPDRSAAARLMAAHLADLPAKPPVLPSSPPQPLTGQSPPVEHYTDPKASSAGQVVLPATQAGRRVDLGPWTRSGIGFGIAAASIFAVVLLMVAGDVIARRHSPPAVVTTANR